MFQILLGIHYAGLTLLVFELAFILTREPSKVQQDMTFLLISLIVIFIGYLSYMNSKTFESSLLALRVGHLGKSFLAVCMLFTILDYCHFSIPKGIRYSIVGIQLVICIIAFTSDKHNLFYVNPHFDPVGVLWPRIIKSYGIAYMIMGALNVAYIVSMIVACIKKYTILQDKNEKKVILLFLCIIFSVIIALILYYSKFVAVFDVANIAYLFVTFAFFLAFFHLHIFDAVSIAKDEVMSYLNAGFLVYDHRGRLIYENALSRKLSVKDKVEELYKSRDYIFYKDKVYRVQKLTLKKRSANYGYAYFIDDETEDYNYKLMLKEEMRRADEASMAKTQFLASMSHDIRTPMNAILGMTNIASLHLDDKERISDCLKKIKVSGSHLLELINEVLDMNKIESGKLELTEEIFDIKELVNEISTMNKPLIEGKNHKFVTDTSGVQHNYVRGDRSRLSQVLMNLVSNSVKYTNEGGLIELSIKEDGCNDTSACYEIVLKDNGIGMSKEFLPTIFDPFSRAKDENVYKAQGTGLGMAITKNFVELMKGDISVDSELGKGSSFTIRVPFLIETEEAVEKLNSSSIADLAKIDLSQKRILLVEDNDINAEIAGEILKQTGVSVDFAKDGKSAFYFVSSVEDGFYDLIFMDVQMPVMNGYDATKAIRALDREYTRSLPIIAMTANAFAEDVREAKLAGMNDHVAKPLDYGKLISVLERYLL